MADPIAALRAELEAETITSEEEAEAFRIKYLGRNQGRIPDLFGQIGEQPPEERPDFGRRLNALKTDAQAKLDAAHERLAQEASGDTGTDLDLTLPGRRQHQGSLHPLTQTLEEILHILERMGFATYEGPEVETDWHNFAALNFPPDHPARDMQDTFFVKDAPVDTPTLLRTHTSPGQIRVLQATEPPVRVMVPGRVYRNEAISYKSFCLFHQVELLYVDANVSMADLKQVLYQLAQALFGADVRLRFRPSYFPFTEPSAEVDIWWADPSHEEGGRWLEILGCGMVHPNVLRAVDVDPEQYSGYAVGMGVERMTMLKHGIDDIRVFYENDLRFLQQF
ncbi:MAG: phenylalanine--tRNA ligase subunit alpha [Longimonas sp.]|uniref:phenylalanine--tRNA ligase subunit alpha n=1 Tax=Longimonas sp. TaxID=2039626 RepID=UPI003359F6B1